MVEQSSFSLLALFWLKIGRCRSWSKLALLWKPGFVKERTHIITNAKDLPCISEMLFQKIPLPKYSVINHISHDLSNLISLPH